MKNALKEWSTVVDALGAGEIVTIWRKGGIGENFSIDNKQFVFFPTHFHEDLTKVKNKYWSSFNINPKENKDNQIKIKYWAEVIEAIELTSLNELLLVADQLANNEEHLKYSWETSPNQAGKLLFLRVYVLNDIILLPNHDSYKGCKSWVELNIDVPKSNSKPVLSFKEYNKKARLIKILIANSRLQSQPVLAG